MVYDGSSQYLHAVERALCAIARGRVDKIVTTRVAGVLTTATAGSVLSSLAGAPGATRFGLSIAAGSFIAATPELLCRVTRERIATEALAGTAASSVTSTTLSESEKDRREQAHVVQGIVAGLASLGASPTELEPPRIKSLTHVNHLLTKIEVARPAGVHVLDVVRALHPTPAVGGWPREGALELLAELESNGRGLYGAPCGWFDANGDGVFVVGIRSALFQRQHASVFAGGGIVAGSEPRRELFETDLKLRALLSALGVDGRTARVEGIEAGALA
jgi:isochorismate synthase